MGQRERSAWHHAWAILLVCLALALIGVISQLAVAQVDDFPELEGMQVDEAKNALQAWSQMHQEWRVDEVQEKPEVPSGANREHVLVLEAIPDFQEEVPDIIELQRGGRDSPRRVLSVTLMLGTRVPDLTGQTWQEARDTLLEHGLPPPEEADPGNASIVERQSPGPDERVPLDERVSLFFALEQPEQRVRVPDVVGKSVSEARRDIQEAALRFASRPAGQARGIDQVLRQRPAPGTLVLPGTRVTVVADVSIPPDETTPDPPIPWPDIGVLFVLLLLLLAVIRAAARAHRVRRERKWVRQHVWIRSSVTPGKRRIDSSGEQQHSVTIVLHLAPGSQVFEEVARPWRPRRSIMH